MVVVICLPPAAAAAAACVRGRHDGQASLHACPPDAAWLRPSTHSRPLCAPPPTPPAGILVTVAGVVWAHCLPEGLRESLGDRLAPVLGAVAVVLELLLDKVIAAWDWARARFSGASQRSAAEAAYFEPLAEVDPEDHRSPPLFPGR